LAAWEENWQKRTRSESFGGPKNVTKKKKTNYPAGKSTDQKIKREGAPR